MEGQIIADAATNALSGVDSRTFLKSASLIGSGLAILGVFGPGVGIGIAGSKALEGMARQPEMASKLFTNTLVVAALMEALGLLSFLISILLYTFGTSI